jgi:hypothetical protein
VTVPADVARRIDALSRVARGWLEARDPLRLEAIERLPGECGLTPELVAWGLDRAFEVIDEATLEAWWAREGGPSSLARSGHIWAGNVFVAGLPPLVASLLAGVPARVKAPSGAPSFARLLVRSLGREPLLAGQVEASAWSRREEQRTQALLDEVDVLFAMGDDASIHALRALSAGRARFCGFGHRYSVALVTPSALAFPDEAIDALAVDHLAWNGAGCLTPRWTFVQGTAADAVALARRAAARLPDLVNALPAPPLCAGEGAERAAWLARTAFLGWSASGPGWGAAALPEPVLRPAPPPRVLCFCPVSAPGELVRLLGPLGNRLQGLALAGVADEQALVAALSPLGLSRIAPAGRLQRPPVHWNHDDVRILASCL